MRIARVDVAQRCGGQTDAGSWTARTLARIGGAAVVAVLAQSCLGVSAAQAVALHGHAGDPSPQAAPGSSASTPAPDPAPQAAPRSTPIRTSTPSTRETTSPVSNWHPTTVISSPVVVAGADIVSHARIQQRPVPRHISAGAFGLTPSGSACAAGTNDLDSSRFVVLPARAAEGPSAPARRRAPGRRSGPPERRVVVAECGGNDGGGGGELHAAAAAAEVGGGMRRLALSAAVVIAFWLVGAGAAWGDPVTALHWSAMPAQ